MKILSLTIGLLSLKIGVWKWWLDSSLVLVFRWIKGWVRNPVANAEVKVQHESAGEWSNWRIFQKTKPSQLLWQLEDRRLDVWCWQKSRFVQNIKLTRRQLFLHEEQFFHFFWLVILCYLKPKYLVFRFYYKYFLLLVLGFIIHRLREITRNLLLFVSDTWFIL